MKINANCNMTFRKKGEHLKKQFRELQVLLASLHRAAIQNCNCRQRDKKLTKDDQMLIVDKARHVVGANGL